MASLRLGETFQGERLTVEVARDKVVSALEKLFRNDRDALQANASERAITNLVAFYLRESFSDRNIDCEWNRDGHKDPKALHLENPDRSKNVHPDIIVHRRMKFENYLVIELKKSTRSSQKDREWDATKLRLFTSPFVPDNGFDYHVGLFLDIRAGRRIARKRKLSAKGTWFVAGQPILAEVLLSQAIDS